MKKKLENIKNKLITVELTARQLKEGAAQLELRCLSIRQELEDATSPVPPKGVELNEKVARALLRKAARITTIGA